MPNFRAALVWSCLIAISAGLGWWAVMTYPHPSSLVELIFCDVGQGDAILIQSGSYQVLIDAGPDTAVLSCLNKHLPWWDKQLELVVATHADQDHIGGMAAVLQAYRPLLIWDTPQFKDTNSFQDFIHWRDTREKNGARVEKTSQGQMLSLAEGRFVLSVLSPPEAPLLAINDEVRGETNNDEINYNDGSIALLLTVGRVKTLLTADMEEAAEQATLAQGLIKDIDILKIAHHGSKTSSTLPFLLAAKPELAIISCGLNNRYHHPDTQVMERLESLEVEVMRTDEEGEVILHTDGEKYWRETQ